VPNQTQPATEIGTGTGTKMNEFPTKTESRVGTFFLGLITVVVIAACLGKIADLTDPRPEHGTKECSKAQIEYLGTHPDHLTKAEVTSRLLDMCK
jgi:hypothetical protein